MFTLSPRIPLDPKAVYAYLATVAQPQLDDLKLMVLLEAAGEGIYSGFARGSSNREVRQLLLQNASEERGHAQRVIRMIKLLHGEDVTIPPRDHNPYYVVPEVKKLTPEMLTQAVKGEHTGADMYDAWATKINNAEVEQLLRQNAREERLHAERDARALELLAAQSASSLD